MEREGMGAVQARMETARRSVVAWRRLRRRGARMPEPLWGEAVSLAGVLGVSAVARFLDIGHQSLRARLLEAQSRAGEPSGEGGAVVFAELSGAELVRPIVEPARPAGASGVVIELTSRDGAQMVVRLGGESAVDVVGLAHAFFGRSR